MAAKQMKLDYYFAKRTSVSASSLWIKRCSTQHLDSDLEAAIVSSKQVRVSIRTLRLRLQPLLKMLIAMKASGVIIICTERPGLSKMMTNIRRPVLEQATKTNIEAITMLMLTTLARKVKMISVDLTITATRNIQKMVRITQGSTSKAMIPRLRALKTNLPLKML
jgi:hypothetical protein